MSRTFPLTKQANVSSTTTLLELLAAGCTISFPAGYELRGDPADGSISRRALHATGLSPAGSPMPLNEFGGYLACNEVNSWIAMVAREDSNVELSAGA